MIACAILCRRLRTARSNAWSRTRGMLSVPLLLALGACSGPATSQGPGPLAVPTDTASLYLVPASLSDGWQVGDLRKTSVDTAIVISGIREMEDGTIPDMNSLLVIQHGVLWVDQYFNGYGVNDPHPLYSVTKSVFSTVYGIAQDSGLVSVDEHVYDDYPGYRSMPGWDPRKDSMTVGMILSMTSGYDCNDIATGNNPTCGYHMTQSTDWLDYCLKLPLDSAPGLVWEYNGSSLVLLSNLIATRSGRSFQAFSDENLFNILGISGSTWKTGPGGLAKVDEGLSWKPRDMAKLGYLYLENGVWNGTQVLSSRWIALATTSHAPAGSAWGDDYGYLWYVTKMPWAGKIIPVFYADGMDGQLIFVAPAADLVCVMTASSTDPSILATENAFFRQVILSAFDS